MVYGFLGLSLSGYVIAILILTQLTIASVTVFLHRNKSNMALKLHPIASHFFRFWLWLATGIKTKEWVSVHRKHHAKCETIEDPHSPKNWGLKTMLLRGAGLAINLTVLLCMQAPLIRCISLLFIKLMLGFIIIRACMWHYWRQH